MDNLTDGQLLLNAVESYRKLEKRIYRFIIYRGKRLEVTDIIFRPSAFKHFTYE